MPRKPLIAFADASPLGRAQRAARRAPGLGHRERTHQAHSRFRHQGADGSGGPDPDGECGRPGALRGRLPAFRSATGPAAPAGRLDQPAAAQVGRHLDHPGDHQCGRRRARPRDAANDLAGQPVCRTSEGSGCAPTTSTWSCRATSQTGYACCTPATTTPLNSPPDCGTCRDGCASAANYSTK